MIDLETTTPTRTRKTSGHAPWVDTARTRPQLTVDVEALRRDLVASLRGEVHFDGGMRAAYSTDASNYRQPPLGVVLPIDTDDLIGAVAICRRHRVPVLHRGAGTSLAGQTTNRAVVIDGSKYLDAIHEIDAGRRLARVQPGVRRDQLARITEAAHGLTFGPDTSTHAYATFGGMLGNNSCGMHSEMAGRTSDNVEAMEVLTYDGCRMHVGTTTDDELDQIIAGGGRRGTIYRQLRALRDRYAGLIRARYPDIPRRVSGYNLDELLPENGFNVARALVGSEGTLVTILEATVRLVPSPPARALVVLAYDDVVHAGADVMAVKEHGPIALEGLDDVLIEDMQLKNLHPDDRALLPEGSGWLFVELGGDDGDEAEARARQLMDRFDGRQHLTGMALYVDGETQQRLWAVRESGLGATARVPHHGDTWPGWEDSACPPERLGDYLRDLRDLYHRHDLSGALYGHFGQGCVHTRIDFDLRSRPGIDRYRAFLDDASDLCVRYGGSLSAEHGDGQARAEMLPKMFGEELMPAFRAFKEIWDPGWMMNPGKVTEPFRVDENLRLGASYAPKDPETHFAFPDDDGSIARAALRCVGVGKCRKHDVEGDAVMCPSFIATHDEQHTTRGRARLLFEMLNGDETPDAWDNDDVFEALDLCLACKGCKNDCPVNVDMATYKAEFLSHYYEHHRRPRSAYAFGLIHWWARAASRVPALVNFFSQTPLLRDVAKRAVGVARQRTIPAFAPQTFRDWFARREAPPATGRRVLLWPDTFNNYFKPDTAKAAVEVLEAAGCCVTVPQRVLCCGRPLYDYGMLDLAKRMWRDILDALRPEIRAGTPVVGLEPSCVAAFRDELINLFPNDWDARRLSNQTFTLAEFLSDQLDHFEPPRLDRTALVHGHCHHKSIVGLDADRSIMDAMGLRFDVVAAGCCGMAGAFGFEEEHFDVSMKAGEYRLLPAVRGAGKDVVVVADGFSCREQIHQSTDRHALHLAEVLHLALHPEGAARDYPERPYVTTMRYGTAPSSRQRLLRAGIALAAGLALGWRLSR